MTFTWNSGEPPPPLPPKFRMGREIRSPLAEKVQLAIINEALWRHAHCEWGDITDEEKAENERSLEAGGPIISAHPMDNGSRLVLVTMACRLITVVALSDELQDRYPAHY